MAKPLLGSRFMRGQEQHQQALGEWLTADTAKAFSRHDMNWVGIIHAAADAGVLPSLYLNSAKPPLSSQLPEEIKDLLFTVHQLNTDRNRTALDQAQQVASALNLLGVQPVALKGLANILAGIYPDVGARYLADIDLLVPAVQFPAAVAAFQSLGYTTDSAHRSNSTSAIAIHPSRGPIPWR